MSCLLHRNFGERWARHWMDLIRYADSHGSEGDPAIPNAFQYRDYLIRAFNADVFLPATGSRAHRGRPIWPSPRINEQLGINESRNRAGPLATFVFTEFAPTDALDEKVRFYGRPNQCFWKNISGFDDFPAPAATTTNSMPSASPITTRSLAFLDRVDRR